MAAWNIGGAMSVRILNTEIYRTRCATLEAQSGVKSLQKHTLCGLRTIHEKKEQLCFPCSSRRRLKRLTSKCVAVACESTSQTVENPSDHEEVKKSVQEKTLFAPNSLQVESLVMDICETSSIAEFKLDFGGFRLYLKRGLEEKSSVSPPPPPPSPSLPAVNTGSAAVQTSGSTALTISKSKSGSTGIQRFLDSASDEGLAILQSPKVGFFRRSRTIKGKRAPPSCQEKQVVKEGQVLCYIEQLGGEIPIESDVSGEVIKILRKDGEPVGYGDALIAVLPSFPGIKKLPL